MARRLKISVLSGSRNIGAGSSAGESYARMKDYWIDRISRVSPDRPDFIVLPEACDVLLGIPDGQKEEYERFREKETQGFFNTLAKELDSAIIYNTKADNRNTTFACSRSGRVAGKYIKTFPTITALEAGIIPGDGATVFEIDGIEKAGFATCFDLNFEELLDEYAKLKPEVIFFNSYYHGDLMQDAWAYRSRSFFIASVLDRESRILAPNGRVLAGTTNYTDYCTAVINLDCELIHLDFHWDKLVAMKEKYGCDVTIDDVGFLGSVLVYCERDGMTVSDLIDEFEMTRLDDYLDHAREVRKNHL